MRETLRLIDTHAHLDEFTDLDTILERAKKSGIVAIIAVGQGHTSNKKTLKLSQKYSEYVFPALGIHPWADESEVESEIAFIKNEIDNCVAIGEIGLDYWIKKDKEVQINVFKKLLELAVKKDKPVSIHTRGSWEEAYHLVQESSVRKAVFHWYSGPVEILYKIVDKGYYVSATPATEYSKAHREVLRNTPLESLLLETDSPVKYKSVEAEPSTVIKTLELVAALKEVSEEVVSETTTENATELFQLNI